MIGKRTSQRVGSPNHSDRLIRVVNDQSGTLSPLTSAGGDSPRGFYLDSEKHLVIPVYPVLPQTLREVESKEDGCRGLVAEPLN